MVASRAVAAEAAVVRALGFDPDQVKSLTLRLSWDAPPTVTVVFAAEFELVDGEGSEPEVVAALVPFRLVPTAIDGGDLP